jgi:hypothetical protein
MARETMREFRYVVMFYDRWDDSTISFTLGPYDGLKAAQSAANLAKDQIPGGYRPHSIQKCLGLHELPEWERPS